jgi:hypothetical protein
MMRMRPLGRSFAPLTAVRAGFRLRQPVLAALVALTSSCAAAGPLAEAARHSSTDYCSGKTTANARVQDRLLRFAAVAQDLLERSGQPLALVARSGIDLQRFGHRYSHAGLSLGSGTEVPWAVRQLYYACDERKPRLFDQGIAGFVFGTDNSETSFLSLTLLPPGEARQALLQTALDKRKANELVAPRYSANAYAFSLKYQNCNQWLVELMGLAWGQPDPTQPVRGAAQQSLRTLGFRPEPTVVSSPWVMLAASFVPLLNLDDHPEEDRAALRLQVSMPSNIEAFVRDRLPSAQRIELCQTEGRIVVRRGWEPLSDDCSAEPGDEVIAVD